MELTKKAFMQVLDTIESSDHYTHFAVHVLDDRDHMCEVITNPLSRLELKREYYDRVYDDSMTHTTASNIHIIAIEGVC